MRPLLTLLTFVIYSASSLLAQSSLQIIDDPQSSLPFETVVSYSCSDIRASTYGSLVNTGTDTLHVKAVRKILHQVNNHEFVLGWNATHFIPSIDSANNALQILPNDSATEPFFLEVYPYNTPGTDTVRLCFYDEANPSDSVCTDIVFSCLVSGLTSEHLPQNPLYPNPSSGLVFLPEDVQPHSVELYAITGKAINVSGLIHQNRMDLSGLTPGIYLVRWQLHNGRSYSSRVVKK